MNSSGRLIVSPYFPSLVPLSFPFPDLLLLQLRSRSYEFLNRVHPSQSLPLEVQWGWGAAPSPRRTPGTRSSSCILVVSLGTEEVAITATRSKMHCCKCLLMGYCACFPRGLTIAWSSLGIQSLSFTPVTQALSLPSAPRICLPFGKFQEKYDSRGCLYSVYACKMCLHVTVGPKSRLLSALIYAFFSFSWSEASPESEPAVLCHLWPPFDLL